eukprot:6187329-Pleurochrysis_carterae.AAC.2
MQARLCAGVNDECTTVRVSMLASKAQHITIGDAPVSLACYCTIRPPAAGRPAAMSASEAPSHLHEHATAVCRAEIGLKNMGEPKQVTIIITGNLCLGQNTGCYSLAADTMFCLASEN